MTVVDRIREQARRRPAQPALLVEDRSGGLEALGYGDLVARFESTARELRAAGLAAGQRCGLIARQGPAFIELALGVLAGEGCLVPIPDDHRGAVLEDFSRRARLHHLLREEAERPGFRPVEGSEAGGVDEGAFRELAPAYLRFTSGTTGRRKGVVLGHATIVERLAAANRALEIGPEDRVLWLLPMAHHFVVSILLYLGEGATVLLPASSLPRPVLELASRAEASVLYASPHHYDLFAKDRSDVGLPRVRLAVSTTDGLRRDVAQRFAQRFDRWIAQALGIIEVGIPVANLRAAASKPEALGRPLPDYEVWLRDEDGKPLLGPTSARRTGEICIRGPGLLDAYLDPWLPAAQVVEPDGFRTGDQAWFDADGDLHLAGRRSNRISMAGMKFFCEEVEEVLDLHPQVRESHVFARPHDHLGEVPVAEIVPLDASHPPDRRDLLSHCRERLASYKIPRTFSAVATLPRTASGKIRRGPGADD